MLKSAFVLALWAGVFKGQSNNNHTVHNIYINVINVSHCGAILSFARHHHVWQVQAWPDESTACRCMTCRLLRSSNIQLDQSCNVLATPDQAHRQMLLPQR